MIPNWLQQLAAECTEEDRRQLDKVLNMKKRTMSPNQAAHDTAYRAKQKAKGIVRKTVLVPESRVEELQALCRQWRAEVKHFKS